MPLVSIVLAFFLALGLSLAGTPLAIDAARRFGLTARPDGNLRVQSSPVPNVGGLVFFGSFTIAYSLVFDYDQRILGLLLAGTLTVVLGLVDDFGQIRPLTKLAGQALAVLVLLKSGIRMDIAALPIGWNVALTALWVLAIMNAMNFLDVMDGLAAGLALIATVFLLAIALWNGDWFIATFTAVLAGALLGYIRFNYPPATIYMGDTGALFLGLMLAALAILADYSERNSLAVLNPLLLLGIPCFEMCFTTGVRIWKGRNPLHGSKDHPVLRLRARGFSVRRTVHAAWIVGIVMGALALWNMGLPARSSGILLAAVFLFWLLLAVLFLAIGTGKADRRV